MTICKICNKKGLVVVFRRKNSQSLRRFYGFKDKKRGNNDLYGWVKSSHEIPIHDAGALFSRTKRLKILTDFL